MTKQTNRRARVIKGVVYAVAAGALFFAGYAMAADTLGDIAKRFTESMEPFGVLMISISYVAGIAFTIASVFKFKQHKDNPTQIPLGTPLALLVIGIVLVFLPSLFGPAGESIFGGDATVGGFKGEGLKVIGK